MVHVGKFWNCWLVIWCSWIFWWVLWNMAFIFPYTGNSESQLTNSYFSDGLYHQPVMVHVFLKPDNGWSNSYLRVTSYHCQPCLFISTHGVRKDPKQIFKMVFQSFLSFSLWFSRWVFPFRGDAHGPLSLPQFWRCCLSSRSGTGVKGEDVMWFSDLLEDFGYFGWFWIIENGDSALLNHPNLAND